MEPGNGGRYWRWIQSIHFALTLALAAFILRQYGDYRDYREEMGQRVVALEQRVIVLEHKSEGK